MSHVAADIVRSTTMQHVDPVAVRYFETLNGAQILYLNSMRIALDPLAPEALRAAASAGAGAGASAGAAEPLRVALRIDFRGWTAAQHTLSVHVAPDCVKRFVFAPGRAAAGIPCSARRATSVEITCYNDGQEVDAACARSFVLDMQQSKSTALSGPATIAGPADTYKFYTAVKHGVHAANFTFSCFEYEADEADAQAGQSLGFEYRVADAFRDFTSVLARPVITPSRAVSIVSAAQAEARLAELELGAHELHEVFDAIFLDTARRELGASEETAEDVAASVDWAQSHAVSGDAAVQRLIAGSKELYTRLSLLSNTAVGDDWLQDTGVQALVKVRQQLADSVRGRRTELGEVARVRSTFLCVDAIDSALREVCSHAEGYVVGHAEDHAQGHAQGRAFRSDALDEVLGQPCHRYWLEQMKANAHNSVPLPLGTYLDAVDVLNACAALRGKRLLPTTNVVSTALGYGLWRSMHLQGLAPTHALPVAPCAHFMYKKRARVDYALHPVVTAAQGAPGALRALHSLALLTMLVSTDVEHRIIPPRLGVHVLGLLERASAQPPAAAEAARQEASAFLTRVLDPQLHSLAASALQMSADPPDLSFITAAGSRPGITGYNMHEVTGFCVDEVLKRG
jgi:hypothetical protein